jgi:hypothetical protein
MTSLLKKRDDDSRKITPCYLKSEDEVHCCPELFPQGTALGLFTTTLTSAYSFRVEHRF